MRLFNSKLFPFAICLTFILSQLLGCSKLIKIGELRTLPGTSPVVILPPFQNNKAMFEYDPQVRAFRLKEEKKSGEKVHLMEVIRNKSGKKVQTREELERYRRSQIYNEFGNGTKAGSFALSVIYFPLVLGKQIVESVLLIPWFPVLKSMENTYERNGEKFYTEGRKALHSGDYLTALEKANEALIAVPSLHAFSDIDYWRGLSYEGINRPEEARKAYEVFLSYSERNIPNYFKNKFEGDMAWEEKAEEVEQKLRRLAPGQAR